MPRTSPAKPPLAVGQLEAGDFILYRPSSVYGVAIWIKTWHRVSHVEVYDGSGMSWASRDGIGVNRYPVRLDHVYKVLRPTEWAMKQWDLDASRKWATEMIGTPYGWLDLTAFIGIQHRFKGIVCSPFACRFAKVGGLSLFGSEPCHFIAPFQFETTPLLKDTQLV